LSVQKFKLNGGESPAARHIVQVATKAGLEPFKTLSNKMEEISVYKTLNILLSKLKARLSYNINININEMSITLR